MIDPSMISHASKKVISNEGDNHIDDYPTGAEKIIASKAGKLDQAMASKIKAIKGVDSITAAKVAAKVKAGKIG